MVVVRSRLEPVRSVAHEHGVKVNDVALAVVTAGLRRLLVLRGERVDRPLRALVPVSLRGADEHGTLGNRVGSLIVPLPIGEPDPVARLRLIGAATAELKQRGDAQVSDGVLAATNLLPTSAVHAVSWIIEHQPLVNLVVTNVPGPSVPLYALGAEMIEAFPILPLAGNLTVGVAILSYNGELNFGIRADAVTCPDVDVLAEAIADAIDELTGHRPVAAMAHAAGAE
jgi:WS/DGAT/MGAT family acyltransferase